jgi:hypothetical protein
VGKYIVVFGKSGFAVLRVESVDQTVGLTRTLNVALTVAAQGEEITVSANLAQLNQTTASLGGRTEQKRVAELPMNGRNWYSLAALIPGAIDSGGSNMSRRYDGAPMSAPKHSTTCAGGTDLLSRPPPRHGVMTWHRPAQGTTVRFRLANDSAVSKCKT